MQKLIFATGNTGKVEEAQAILKMPIEIANLELFQFQVCLPGDTGGREGQQEKR
jgi:inosine/xanthosine triphosphate pyrophosphatase family protein